MSRPSVLVMMATYNGERYVGEQIESILRQRDVDATLLISDDGSSDGTCAVCEDYAARDSRIRFRRNSANKGLARNFMGMVYDEGSDGYDYYAFSDQDDVWLPEKLVRAVEALREEVPIGPALYYSDVENVNEGLGQGEREYAGFARCVASLGTLLVVNWASGCTMVFDSSLRDLLRSYAPPEYPRIHDSWVHLVGMTCGTAVADLDHSYIKRRLTGKNQVGARNLEETQTIGQIARRWRRVFHEADHAMTKTAGYLLDGFGDCMVSKDVALVRTFSEMPHSMSARTQVARRLLGCPFPTKSMAKAFSLKAVMNRM